MIGIGRRKIEREGARKVKKRHHLVCEMVVNTTEEEAIFGLQQCREPALPKPLMVPGYGLCFLCPYHVKEMT